MRPLAPLPSYRVLSALARRMAKRAVLTILLSSATLAPVHAAQWMDVATISNTLTNTKGRLCVGGGRTDIGCPVNSPLLDSAAGLLTVPGDLRVIGNLYVSGSQQFDGVTFSNGGVSATGTVTATSFTGSGAGLNNIPASAVVGLSTDRIVSTSANVIVGTDGLVRFSTGGVTNTAYLDTSGRLVNSGVSTTGPVSTTSLYSVGFIGIGATSASVPLEISSSLGSALAPALKITNSNSNGNAFSQYVNNGGNSMYIGMGGGFSGANNTGIIRFSNSSYGMQILTSRLGIWTDQNYHTPSATLDISGNLKISNNADLCDANRLGAIKYQSSTFQICQSAANGWEPLATATSTSTISINTGISGSLVYRNEYGVLMASNSLSISSTTGSVGIGAGAPASIGSNGLYASGGIKSGSFVDTPIVYLGNATGLYWGGNSSNSIIGDVTTAAQQYLKFTTAGNEAMRIVSTGLVGIGTSTPKGLIDVNKGSNGSASNWSHFGGNTGANPLFNPYVAGEAGIYLAYNRSGGDGEANIAYGMGGGANPGLAIGSWDGGAYKETVRIVSNGFVGIGTSNPSTTLQVSGTLRIANGGEACDANRVGAIKYTSNAFYICQNTANGWESLATTGANSLADRITSNSQAGVIANATGYISLTTGGVTGTVYFTPAGKLVNAGVSTTGPVSATSVYAGNFGKTGSIIYRDANGVLKGNTGLVYNTSGTVEVGTGAPSWLVNGIWSEGYFATNTFFNLQNYTGVESGVLWGGGEVGIYGNLGGTARYLRFATNSNEAMRIVSTGYVGIGIATPTTALNVSGTLRIASGGESCDASRIGAMKYQTNNFYVCQNTSNGWEPLATATSTSTISINTGASGSLVYRNEYGVLYATNTLSISSTTGSVGIGAGAPASLGTNGLYATGSIGTGSYFYGNTFAGLTGIQNSMRVDTGLNNITFLTNNTEALRIVSTGLVGIGTSSPSATLHVVGTAGNQLMVGANTNGNSGIVWGSTPQGGQATIQTDSAHSFIFSSRTGGTIFERMRLNWDGNNGFGTSSPKTLLDVSGTLRIANTNEACDANRTGAIRYTGGTFSVCQTAANGWEPLATGGVSSTQDRITSNSQAGVIANATGYISLTTGGVTGTAYFAPGGVYVGGGVSTTGGISGTTGYFTGNVGIGTSTPSFTLQVAGTLSAKDIQAGGNGFGTASLSLYNSSGNRTVYMSSANNASNFINASSSGAYSALLGIGTIAPSTTLHVSGTLRIADGGESCDTNRIGAMKYSGGAFYICQNTSNGWEPIATAGPTSLADRITSNSQAGVIANATGYISLTTGGVTGTTYFTPGGKMVTRDISLTGVISATSLYLSNNGYTQTLTGTRYDFKSPNSYVASIGTDESSLFQFSNGGQPRLTIRDTGLIGISTSTPSTTLDVVGTIKMADGGESCDASRLGAIKYSANNFYVCRNGSSWETMSASGASSGNPDRIVSGTAAVYTNQTGSSISLTTSSIERMIINASGYVGINQQPTNGVYLAISGTTSITGRLGLSTPSTFNVIAGSFAGSALTGSYNAVYGYTAGQNNTGSNNVLMGTYAGQNNTGSNAVVIGYAAGLGNTGSSTVLVGNVAGQNNTGAFSTSIGNAAGQYNTGTNLTAVGASTAQSNTGINVSAFGFSAAQFNTGGYVTAIGQSAAYSNTGTNLTAIGYNSAYNNTAANITAIGTNSMLYHTSGANNVALGINSGLGVNGTSTYADSTLLGSYAGQGLTSGNSNTLVGYNAGGGITTGSNNLIIGTNLSPFSNTGSYQLNIANAIWGNTGSGTGNANKIGINVTSPTANLEVSGTISATAITINGQPLGGALAESISMTDLKDGLVSSTNVFLGPNVGKSTVTGGLNTAYGFWALGNITTGTGNVALGTYTLGATTTGNYNMGIGMSALSNNSTGSYNVGLGQGALTLNQSGSGNMAIGASALANVTTGSGNIGIGNSAGSYVSSTSTGNIFIGDNAGKGVADSSFNNRNIAIGGYAGNGLTTGSSNTLLGYNTGAGITTGENNLILGANLSPFSNTGNNQLNIANAIFGDYGRALASKIGINVTSPTANLEVSGTISATRFIGDGSGLTGAGVSKFASLTDVSYSLAGNNIFGPGTGTGSYAGINNTTFGISTMGNGTNTGSNNTTFGYNTLLKVTTGSFNAAFGPNSLYNVTTGQQNTAINNALTGITTGSYNVGVGLGAGGNVTVGSANTVLGRGAMRQMQGSGNSVVGDSTLYNSLLSVTDTVVIGRNAVVGDATTSFQNAVIIGSYAATNLTTGSSNTIIGYNAAGGLTTGGNNLVIGTNTSPYSNTGNSQLNIANAIWGNIGSGMSNANLIGINVASPTTNLEVSGTISATRFVGDGSGLTNLSISGDRITSGTSGIYVSSTGIISIAASNTSVGNINKLGLVINGISTTGAVSASSLLVQNAATVNGRTFLNGGIVLNQGVTAIDNMMYLRQNYSGHVDASMGFFAAGAGSSDSTDGPYFLARGNDFSNLGNQRGNMIFSAGNPTSPGTLEGSIQFWSGSDIRRMIIDNSGKVGINLGSAATTAQLDVSGTIKMADSGEACDISRLGAIKYKTNQFYVCKNTVTGWEAISAGTVSATITDRITSGTTSMMTYNNTSATIATAGTERLIVGTNGNIGIAQQPETGLAVAISGTTKIRGRLELDVVPGSGLVFVGNNNGSSNTGGYEVLGMGNGNAQINTGTSVVAIGSLNASVNAGSNVVALGRNSAYMNTGDRVIAIGDDNAAGTNTGSDVIALGGGAAGNNSGLANIIGIGSDAANANGGSNVVALGNSSAYGNTADDVVSIGNNTAYQNSGVGLVAIGKEAGNGNIADQVIALGTNSSMANQGANAITIGQETGYGNTGAHLVAMGFGTARDNTGADLVAIGHDTADSNTGNYVVALGTKAAFYNKRDYTVALGYKALNQNVGGSGNTAVGGSALAASANGSFNTALGSGTGSAATGVSGSTLIGAYAGQLLTTGSSNTLLGYNAGSNLTSGANNLAIGAATGLFSATGSYQLNIANAIWGNFGSGTGNANFIGINVTSPTANLEVSGTVSATRFVGDGSGLTGLSAGSGDRITSGTTSIIANNNTSISFTTAGTVRMAIAAGGNIGIAQAPAASNILAVTGVPLITGRLDILSAAGHNVLVGAGAGYFATGTYNVGLGENVLQNSGASNYNTAIGNGSGFGNTGSYVTAVGYNAANLNTGSYVAAVGSSAAQNNKASYVTAIGNAAAGNNLTSGTTAIGYSALVNNTTGLANTGIGYTAQQFNVNGSYNTSLGYAAGQGVIANSYSANTLLGSYTGLAITTGSSNTIVGANSGMTLTTGNNNILIGAGITPIADTGSGQLSIGNAIFGNIGSGLGLANKIGINVTSPTANLEVSGTVSVTSLFVNGVAVGSGAGVSGDRITSGTTSVIANNNGAISFTTAGTERMAINAAGNVGIGTAPTSAALTITGRVSIQTATSTSIYIGSGSGSFATGGTNNVAVGPNALGYATSGYTVAVGNSAGQNNTGSYSTLLGASAGTANTGTNAVAIGSQAGGTNTGNYLTAIGSSAAYSNQAVGTTAIGNLALYNNTTGTANTAVGYNAMQYNATGTGNTALGYAAGLGASSNNFSNNTLLGAYTGTALTTGSSNTLVGYNVGAGITTGSNNLLIGTNLSPFSNTGSNQLNIANAIFGNIGSGTGNANFIGINVTSPTANLEVSGTVSTTMLQLTAVTGSAGVSLTATGVSTLASLTDVAVGTPTSGSVLTYNGTTFKWNAIAASGGLTDRIVSGSTSMVATSTSSIISLTTGVTTWGYFGSTASYLPYLNSLTISSTLVSATNISSTLINAASISSTNVSASFIQLQSMTGSAGVSVTIAGGADNLGNHTATQDLTMATFNITGIGVVSATGTIKTTAALQSGNTDTTCSTTADYGKMRFDQATGRLYLCRP